MLYSIVSLKDKTKVIIVDKTQDITKGIINYVGIGKNEKIRCFSNLEIDSVVNLALPGEIEKHVKESLTLLDTNDETNVTNFESGSKEG